MNRKFLILADESLAPLDAKTAVAALRYIPGEVVAVLDRSRAGRTAGEVLGLDSAAPVVSSVAEGIAAGARAVLVGIAPVGGELPPEWRIWVGEALRAGLDVWAGMHSFLADDPEFSELARVSGSQFHDLRRVPLTLPVASRRAAELPCAVVVAVGSDCNVGKMTAMLELHRACTQAGIRSRFVATGQTGILVEGSGLAVDRMISDFAAGAVESLVLEAAAGADVVLVEGQGSIYHPGYSGVTLSLLHGAAPDALILCHQPSRTAIRGKAGGNPIPGYAEMVHDYQRAAGWVRPARVLALSLNTFDLEEDYARAELERAARETRLPVADPVRWGTLALLEALQHHLSGRSHG